MISPSRNVIGAYDRRPVSSDEVRMKLRRLIALISVMALLAAACGGGTAASSQKEVIIGLQLEPPTLDLTASPAAGIPQVLLYNVYEGLVKLDEAGAIQPLLAESWELNDDGTEYTFSLVEAQFHNGDPFTADDVVFSINNVIGEGSEHPFKETLASIESVEAVDERTVKITLSAFSANLLFFLTQGQGVILNQNAIADIATNPDGTGPFMFDNQVPGDSITLVANTDYWGTAAPLEQVTYRYINDPNALNNAMLAGDIDILAGVSAPELLESFQDNSDFDVYTGLTNGEVTLAINGANAPLDDLRVRQAINTAIDSQAIIDGAYFGYGTQIGSHTTPLDPYYIDLTDVYPYDPDEARNLLAEAGVEDLTLRLLLPPVSYATRGGEIVASQLEDVGINVEISNVEWGVWLEDVFNGDNYDLSIVAHVEPRDIGQYGNPDYYWAYDNPEVAAMLKEADAEPDEGARNDIYGNIQREITADAANAWLFLLPSLSVTKAGISGYIANAPGLSLDITQLAFNP